MVGNIARFRLESPTNLKDFRVDASMRDIAIENQDNDGEGVDEQKKTLRFEQIK